MVVKCSIYLDRHVFVMLCFEQKCKNNRFFLSENFQFLVVKFSEYLNSRVFVMKLDEYISEKFSLFKNFQMEFHFWPSRRL